MTFQQAMIVPTMVSLGLGSLLLGQNLSLMEVSYAAPASAAAGAVGMPAPGAGTAPRAGRPGADANANLPLGAAAGASSAEFTPGGATKPRQAISDLELAKKAVEVSGREDPFMALIPPEPASILPPPVSFPPLKPIAALLPPVAPVSLPPAPKGPIGMNPLPTPRVGKPAGLPRVPVAPGGTKPAPVAVQPSPKPAPVAPEWVVRGIISTSTDRMTLLEQKDDSIQARVGDVLPDGSRVVAISSRGVTFVKEGKRFVKQIGGTL